MARTLDEIFRSGGQSGSSPVATSSVTKKKRSLSDIFGATERKAKVESNIQNERTRREEEGLPVSVRKNRAEPTKAGEIVRDIGRPFAKAFAPLVEAIKDPKGTVGKEGTVDKALAERKSKYLGKYSAVGTTGQRELREKVPSGQTPKEFYGKDLKKEIRKSVGKDVKEMVGTGAEIASNVPIGGGVATVGKAVFKTGAKELFKQFGKTALRTGLETGLGGALSQGGRALAEGKKVGEIFKETAKGGAGGFVGGALLGLAGKGVGTLLNKLKGEISPAALKEIADEVRITKRAEAEMPISKVPDMAQEDKALIDKLTPTQKESFSAGSPKEKEAALEHLRLKNDLETNDAMINPVLRPLSEEASKYKTADEFVEGFSKKTKEFDKNVFGDSTKIPQEQQKLNDAFMEYVKNPKVQARYNTDTGYSDKQALKDFFNDIKVNDAMINPELRSLSEEARKYKSVGDFVRAKVDDVHKLGSRIERARDAEHSIKNYSERIQFFKDHPNDLGAKSLVEGKPYLEYLKDRLIENKTELAKLTKDGSIDDLEKRLSSLLKSPSEIDVAKFEKVYNESHSITQKPITKEIKAPKIEPSKEMEITKVPRTQLPVGEGKEKLSRFEARIKEKLDLAEDDAIDQLGISTYKQMNIEENISKAVKYATDNPKEALEVLEGKRLPPEGVHPMSIGLALEEMATGDSDLALKLTSLRGTHYGQGIRLLAERDPNSPVKYLEELKKRKIEALGDVEETKILRKNELKKLKSIQAKSKPTVQDWTSFVDSITC